VMSLKATRPSSTCDLSPSECRFAKTAFERSYSVTSRFAAVRAALTTTTYRLPSDFRLDLVQEILLALWRQRQAFDPRRGSWRTFSECVVANKLSSLVRRMRSNRSGQFREDSLENAPGLAAPSDGIELCTDVRRVLARVSQFDRTVALYLIEHSAIETTQCLRVSRATVYRAIGRLRTAFTEAGLSP